MPPDTTSAGVEICPIDEGMAIDTCGGLRADPVCRFVELDCAPGADVGGVCHLEEARFTCDREITCETYGQQSTLSCPDSEIRIGLAALTAS